MPRLGKTENKNLEPIWSCGPILPSGLIDVIEKTITEVEKDEHQGESESDYMTIIIEVANM